MHKYYIRFKCVYSSKHGNAFLYIGMDDAPSRTKYCFTTDILEAEMFDIHEANSLAAILTNMLSVEYVRRSLGIIGPPMIIPAENAAGVWPKSLARFMPDAT
jgi:hypothetical protein